MTRKDADKATPPTREDFRLLHRLRVRWSEVDVQGIVFNAHYLTWFDVAVVEYWRALGLPYQASMQHLGGDLYVRRAGIEFHASARMDERVDVGLRCAHIGNSSLRFEGGIFRGSELLVTGELVYVFADPAVQASRPLPAPLREALASWELGEPPVEVRTGPWSELGEAAARVRTLVFVEEQKIPPEMEWDEADASALHAVAFNRLGQAVATGRLLQPQPGMAQIGRMAVLPALRGSGIGQRIMVALLDAAARRGDTRAVLHAQRSAQDFYTRLGFTAQGEPFDEVGIEHVVMSADLPMGAQR